jgi:hypothetical protein
MVRGSNAHSRRCGGKRETRPHCRLNALIGSPRVRRLPVGRMQLPAGRRRAPKAHPKAGARGVGPEVRPRGRRWPMYRGYVQNPGRSANVCGAQSKPSACDHRPSSNLIGLGGRQRMRPRDHCGLRQSADSGGTHCRWSILSRLARPGGTKSTVVYTMTRSESSRTFPKRRPAGRPRAPGRAGSRDATVQIDSLAVRDGPRDTFTARRPAQSPWGAVERAGRPVRRRPAAQ